MFRTVPLPIIRIFSLYTQQRICHTGLLTACEQDQNGTVLNLLASFMTYTIAVSYSEKLLMMDRGTLRNT